MAEKDNHTYRSTLRSASKKVDLLNRSLGISKDLRTLIGVLGWQVREGARKSPGTAIAAVNSLLNGNIDIATRDFSWITTKAILEVNKLKSGSTSNLMMSEAEKLEKSASERLITRDELNRILAPKMLPTKSRRSQRTNRKVEPEEIQKIDKFVVVDRRRLFAQATDGHITTEVAATYIRPMYLLGMRPSEATDFDILTPLPNLDDNELRQAYQDVETAEKKGWFIDVQKLGHPTVVWGKIMQETPFCDNPLVVKIYSRKKGHLEGEHIKDIRFVSLQGIDLVDKEAIYWTAQWKHMFFKGLSGHEVRDTDAGVEACDSVTRRIRRRLPNVFRQAGIDPFDLTTLRHNFATRCRDTLDHPEAAALLGHSGPRTTGGYGKRQKRWRKKRGSSGESGWMPTPDPATVEVLAKQFYPDEPATDPQNVPDSKAAEKAPADEPEAVARKTRYSQVDLF